MPYCLSEKNALGLRLREGFGGGEVGGVFKLEYWITVGTTRDAPPDISTGFRYSTSHYQISISMCINNIYIL